MHRLPRDRARRTSLLAAALVAALCAQRAPAAELTAVRVGAHPKFTRVVFQLDSAAGYRVERVGTDAAPVLRVVLDASSGARQSRAAGDVRSVKVEAGSRALAHIALGKPGLRLQEMILSNPPRIVLDLFAPETALAAAPKTAPARPRVEPAPQPIAKPAPVPKPAAEAKPAPKPAAPPPEPKPVAPPPVTRAEVEPAEPPEPALEPAPRAAEPPPAPAETAMSVTPPPVAPPQPAPMPEPPETPAAPKPSEPQQVAEVPAPAPPAEPIVPLPPGPPSTPPAIDEAPGLARGEPTPPPPESRPSIDTSWIQRVIAQPIWIGGAAAALLVLVAIAVALRRRPRALPNDLDVTAIADEVEASGRIPSNGFAMSDASAVPSTEAQDDESFDGLFDAPAAVTPPAARPAPPAAPPRPAGLPSPAATPPRPAPAAAPTAAPPRPAAAPPPAPAPRPPAAPAPPARASDTDSLFDDAGAVVGDETSQGDEAMNPDMDLPADRRTSPSSPPPRMGGSAAPSPDITRLLQDLERRVKTLEGRLDEANEAREKVERQVAAQSEELRVQRAAIARTQRALRTMTRAEEDKATEPALRDGDTQTKTRVNV